MDTLNSIPVSWKDEFNHLFHNKIDSRLKMLVVFGVKSLSFWVLDLCKRTDYSKWRSFSVNMVELNAYIKEFGDRFVAFEIRYNPKNTSIKEYALIEVVKNIKNHCVNIQCVELESLNLIKLPPLSSNLRELRLIDDTKLQKLPSLPKLSSLTLSGMRITKLHSFPNVKTLRLISCCIHNPVVLKFRRLKTLIIQGNSGRAKNTQNFFHLIKKISKHNRTIRNISLKGNIDPESVYKILDLQPKLLILSYCSYPLKMENMWNPDRLSGWTIDTDEYNQIIRKF